MIVLNDSIGGHIHIIREVFLFLVPPPLPSYFCIYFGTFFLSKQQTQFVFASKLTGHNNIFMLACRNVYSAEKGNKSFGDANYLRHMVG
jgi:hypothetical protein